MEVENDTQHLKFLQKMMKLHIFCCFVNPDDAELLEDQESNSRRSSYDRDAHSQQLNPLIIGLARHLRDNHRSTRASSYPGGVNDLPPKYDDIYISLRITDDDGNFIHQQYPPPPTYEDSIQLALVACSASSASNGPIASCSSSSDIFYASGTIKGSHPVRIYMENEDPQWMKPPKTPPVLSKSNSIQEHSTFMGYQPLEEDDVDDDVIFENTKPFSSEPCVKDC